MDDVVKKMNRRVGCGAALLALAVAPVGRADAAAIKVPCDVAALATAVDEANTAGVGIVKLASKCIYAVTTPATASEAFPIITGDVTIVGKKNTVIARDPSVAEFRLFTIAAGGTLHLKKVAIKQGSTAGLGGGVLVNGGTLVAERASFSDNTAGNGGAIALAADSTATVKRSAFVLNGTTGVGGGGILNSGTLTIVRSSFANNSGPINGGAINTQGSGTTTVIKSTIGHNRSGGLGGALSNLGTLVVQRSTLFSNTGSAGGAIATGNQNVTLDHVRIEDNVPDNCSPLNTIDGCVDPTP